MTAVLEPVRSALVDAAQTDARRIRRQARAAAAVTLRTARADAQRILDRSRTQAHEDAAAVIAAAEAAARRQQRDMMLAAQRAAYDAVAARVQQLLEALPSDRRYPALLQRLENVAHAMLGDGARIVPAEAGGLVATAPGRRLDLSLPALAEAALRDAGVAESDEPQP